MIKRVPETPERRHKAPQRIGVLQMKSKISLLGLTAGLGMALSTALIAGSVTLPNSFTAGTPARASEVNANFSAVATAVNDNHNRITAIESLVAGDNLVLGPSTATTGNVLKGSDRFIHNFGTDNTFAGVNAGNFTLTGTHNTASGVNALASNTSGGFNTSMGTNALQSNAGGSSNVAIGASALADNVGGSNNTAIGRLALSNNTGGGNIAIGLSAGASLTSGSDNIHIGNTGNAAEGRTIRIGTSPLQTRTFIAAIRGITTDVADAVTVVVDSNGQLGTVSSSGSVKDNIADMNTASSVLMQLRPVTFNYKSDRNPAGRALQYGLIAEEVKKIAPQLVARSANGTVETVYYHFLPPMLLNEYQKQQRTIAAQKATLDQQVARIEALERRLAQMAATVARLDRPMTAAAAAR
jgi:hypothetical protein